LSKESASEKSVFICVNSWLIFYSVSKFLLKIQKKSGIIPIIRGGPPNGSAESRTLRDSSSTNQTVLATKKFRMVKSQENAVLNILTENSCLFVVIPYIFSVCLGVFVAMSQLCKTNPIYWMLK
jgi:hypothetical protein